MGGRPGGDHAHEVPGHDRIRIRSADAAALLATEWIDAAGAHIADAATDPELAEAALRLLRFPAVPGRLHLLVPSNLKHFLRGAIYALLFHSNLPSRNLQPWLSDIPGWAVGLNTLSGHSPTLNDPLLITTCQPSLTSGLQVLACIIYGRTREFIGSNDQ
jgi:hypothetical protein